MTNRPDLTRWNRSGLRQFRYVDGNAVTQLELLRSALESAFNEGGTLRWPAVGAPPSEDERAAFDRLVAQYRQPRQDHAWEILRTLARSTHVLTEHLDAYANESFLRTATQWENVRKLVEMIDYHPAPPASASTALALHARKDRAGLVEAGFAVKNQPADGGKPVVFETLEDLVVDHALNEVRLAGWNQSQEVFTFTTSGDETTATIALDAALDEVSVGSLGLLIIARDGAEEGIPVAVTALSEFAISLRLFGEPSAATTIGRIRFLFAPAFVSAPRLHGAETLELDRDVSIKPGDRLAWFQGGAWHAAEVRLQQGRRLRLDLHGATLPTVNETLYHMARTTRHDGFIVIPRERGAGKTVWGDNFEKVASGEIEAVRAGEDSTYIRDEIRDGSRQNAWFVYEASAVAARVIQASPSSLDFDGDGGDLASGQWVLLSGEGDPVAARITRVVEGDRRFTLETDATGAAPAGGLVHGDFAVEARPAGHNANAAPAVAPGSGGTTQDTLQLALHALPESLAKGRRLIVRSGLEAELVTVQAAFLGSEGVEIVVEPRLTGLYPKNETTILGNVVSAGQGESQPTKILGSGDATRMHQEMVFKTEDVSFTPDPHMPAGVAAAITVTVENQIWQQVANLRDSAPEDPHFSVRLTEDGYLCLRFGDGFQGRRLPTGHNKVRLQARLGVGLAGNLPTGSLATPLRPHPLLDAVEQPLESSGGNDRESVDSLRENAPATLLALARAVSLEDFTALAMSHSGLWQAHAYTRPSEFAHHESVTVAAVPAGGGLLGPLADEVTAYLRAHALPGVRVEVVDYRPVFLSLEATVRVKFSEFDPDSVVAAVKAALADAFSLERRKLGQPLFRSEVFATLEAVNGVENASCTLFVDAGVGLDAVRLGTGPDGLLRSIRPARDQLLHLDPDLSAVLVEAAAFSL